MRCRYCFYCDEAENRSVKSYGLMSRETAEKIIVSALAEGQRSVSFAFQGGEPTLAGKDFFRFFTDKVNELNTGHKQVYYSIQTNGYFGADREWAEIFRQNDFLVGLSFDGTRELHNYFRRDSEGEGTASKVLAAAEMLNAAGVRFNVLTVLTPALSRKIRSVWNFFRKQGWDYIQFIPCLPPIGETGSDCALSGKEWLECYSAIADMWYEENYPCLKAGKAMTCSVRHLDDYLRIAAGGAPCSCGALGHCSLQNLVEADGSVYPCDFYALDGYCLGNISEKGFSELNSSERAAEFVMSSASQSEQCGSCKWFPICRGGCRRYRTGGEYMYYPYCREYYERTFPKISGMAALLDRSSI